MLEWKTILTCVAVIMTCALEKMFEMRGIGMRGPRSPTRLNVVTAFARTSSTLASLLGSEGRIRFGADEGLRREMKEDCIRMDVSSVLKMKTAEP